VFREEAIYRSIHAEKTYPCTRRSPMPARARIDLWELAVADDKQDIEGWRAPFDGVPVTSAEGQTCPSASTAGDQGRW
jgi:ATP-dependent helicase/nuclease subunit A